MTWYYDSSIANSRGLVAGNNVTISNAVDGQCTISAQVTGSGATSSGSYLTMVTEASLPQSRVATEGNGITITDAGAGSTGTIGVSTAITGADILTWQPGDTIFTDRRALVLGSGLLSQYGTNTLTLSVTGQNAGTVTSVGLSAPSWLTVGSSPITTAGTISLTATNQVANTLLIGPSGGADAPPTFRKLLGVDLPISGGSNIVLSTDATGGLNIASTGGGSGTVSSVGLTASNIFAVTGSPVTTSGTLDLALESQAQSTFLAAPSGGVGTPFFRIVTRNDLPITPGSNVSFTLNSSGGIAINASVSGGGGGSVTSVDSTTPTSLFTVSGNPITLSGTLAYALTSAASSKVWAGPVSGADAEPTYRSLVAGDIPTLPFTKISGTVPISQGGTNLTATPVNGQLPIGNGTDYTLATLTPGTGVQVSNGAGTITVSATGALGGTVTSVAQSVPTSLLSITGSPITTAGTLALGLTNAASGQFWAGPTSGADGTPAYRSILVSDLPSTVGTVQSVALALPDIFSVSGSPVTTSGTLTGTFTNQASATVFAGPTSGADATPAFRALVASDIPSGIDATKIADGSVTSTEFQYINTLSSNAQTQIDGKAANTEAFLTLGTTSGLTSERNFTVAGGLTQQDNGAGGTFVVSASALQPLDATLTALAAYNAAGFVTQTGVDTFAGRTLAVAGGLTIQEAGSVITISASGVTGGGGGFTANTITTSATAVVSNSYFVDLSSGNVTLALPTAVSQGGKEIKVKIIANTVPPNTLTLNATATNGAGTIDGSANTITSQYTLDAWTFQSANGSAWYIF